MFISGARAFLLAAFVCGVLAACDDSAEQTDGTVTITKKSDAPKVPGLAPEMVAAVSAGKTATMLSVHFALRAPPTVNKALPVDIAIVPHRDFIALRAHFESHDGLAMTTGEIFGPEADLAAEKPLKHQLILLPSKDGVFMITAIVETEGADGTVTRIFSIPVIVASGAESAVQKIPAAAPDAAKPVAN